MKGANGSGQPWWEILAAAFARPRGSTMAAAGGDVIADHRRRQLVQARGEVNDMRELAEAFQRAKATA